MRFLMRWLVTSIAVAVAVLLIPGISVYGPNAALSIVVVALVLGLLNATLGTLLKIGAFGCILLTFGLFNLVINAVVLWLASLIMQDWFHLGFAVDGFWPAFWGGIVIAIVSGLLNWLVPREDAD